MKAMVRFALILILFSSTFNAAFSHHGETVLITIPAVIPILGGPITLEALAFGVINGLVLAAILCAFAVVSKALPVRNLIRLIPQGYYPLAIVLSIALTFLPVTLGQFKQIRDAQAVRGHRVRGLKDWLPLLMPLLIGGLERAFNLAEAMTARGFGGHDQPIKNRGGRLALLAGLLVLMAGWLLRLGGREPLGTLLTACGIVAIGLTLWQTGRRTRITSYEQEHWSWRDSLVVAAAGMALSVYLLPIPGLDQTSLVYNPYPKITLPAFDPLIGIFSLGLLAPLWIVIQSTARLRSSTPGQDAEISEPVSQIQPGV